MNTYMREDLALSSLGAEQVSALSLRDLLIEAQKKEIEKLKKENLKLSALASRGAEQILSAHGKSPKDKVIKELGLEVTRLGDLLHKALSDRPEVKDIAEFFGILSPENGFDWESAIHSAVEDSKQFHIYCGILDTAPDCWEDMIEGAGYHRDEDFMIAPDPFAGDPLGLFE